jgi:hypothetical protein
LLLDKGFDYLQAMHDALQAGRFQLAVTLLSKTKDDAIIKATDTDKRNLIHILAIAAQRSVGGGGGGGGGHETSTVIIRLFVF